MTSQDPGRHRTQQRESLLERLADRWWSWAAASLLWAWVTYRTAELELHEATVATTTIATIAAFAAGHRKGTRQP